MARRRPTNYERRSKLPPSAVQPRLECSLCHRHRSSRILDAGLSNFDRLICSRMECSKFKAILEILSSSRPVFQTINFITNNDSNNPAIGGAKATAAACKSPFGMENRERSAEKATRSCQAVELIGESSTVGRAELPGECFNTVFETMGHLGSLFDATENPPWVNYATKPVRR